MPKFTIQVPDGRKLTVQADNEQQAMQGVQQWWETNNPQTVNSPGLKGLPIPGTAPEQGFYNQVPPNQRFGFSQSDTPNPVPAINAFANEAVGNIPIAGPHLSRLGDQADAWLENNIYGPMAGSTQQATPESVRAANTEAIKANPEAATAGRFAGPLGAFAAASRIPGVSGALGFEGPWMQRLLMGTGSQYAINLGDNMARGDSPEAAASRAIYPSLIAGPMSLFGRTAAPKGNRQSLVESLKREGVPLTGGQSTGSRTLQYAESELGGGAAEAFMEKQAAAYTKAALKRAGIDAEAATPDVISNAFSTIGGKLDRLAASTNVPLDKTLQDDMLKAVERYQDTTGTPAPIVEKLMNRVAELAGKNGGVLEGPAYQNIRSEMGEIARNADGPTKIALGQLREALDDAVERNISTTAHDAWQQTRRQYANLLDIQDAIVRAGPQAAQGFITPANLSTAIRDNPRAYAKGAGDFNELARSGVAVMSPLPQSGTAPRQAVRNLAMGPTAIAGALTGHDVGGIPGALAGALAGSAVPAAIGRALLSRAGRAATSGRGSALPSIIARTLIAGGGGGY